MKTAPAIHIRAMQLNDLRDVAELERVSGDVHWSEAQLSVELKKPLARYYVAFTVEEKIVGYVGGWVIVPELQIANIVIHADFRCRGIGRRLLEALLDQARREGCTESTLEVRQKNTHAQALYRAAGYHETGVRAKVYQNPMDDAVLMEKTW